MFWISMDIVKLIAHLDFINTKVSAFCVMSNVPHVNPCISALLALKDLLFKKIYV